MLLKIFSLKHCFFHVHLYFGEDFPFQFFFGGEIGFQTTNYPLMFDINITTDKDATPKTTHFCSVGMLEIFSEGLSSLLLMATVGNLVNELRGHLLPDFMLGMSQPH